jgi:curved DNA-binding protein CbpA
MAAADHGGPGPDLYRLLGVPREASREEIAQAWRRRARDEHPDARPADVNAPGRFRALAEAYHVLGDPGRRAAYDRVLAGEREPAAGVTIRRPPGAAGPDWAAPPLWMAGPPLVAGPVRVERPGPGPSADDWAEEDVRLAALAELMLRHLARHRGRRW